MSGALTIVQGVVFVARSGARGGIVPHDLEGRRLGRGFHVRGLDGAPARLTAIAGDVDRRVWGVDPTARALRAWSAFGTEVFLWRDASSNEADRAGNLGRPVGVAASGVERDARLFVASAGERRHALHWVDPHERIARSLRSTGDAEARFRRLAGVAVHGRFACACETGAARVQVFRDGEFHFAFAAPPAPGTGVAFEPIAIARLADGRMLVVQGGEHAALLAFDRAGRLERVLAGTGLGAGELFEPSAVAADGEGDDARVAVLDQDGERVQVFTLEGRACAAFDRTSGAGR